MVVGSRRQRQPKRYLRWVDAQSKRYRTPHPLKRDTLPMVKLLVGRGADRSIKDELYHSTAEGGAEYFGKVDVRDYLRSLADD